MSVTPLLAVYVAGAVPVAVAVFVRTARSVAGAWRAAWREPLSRADETAIGVLATAAAVLAGALWPAVALGAALGRAVRTVAREAHP